MKVYTYQIGPAKGDVADLAHISHSETVGAADLLEAIEKARTITNRRLPTPTETRVKLLEEVDGDSILVWFRPVSSVREV
jgi:hypothetical protein